MNDDWSDFVKEQQQKLLDEIIVEEKLKPEATYQFVLCSFRDREIVEGGTEITQIIFTAPYLYSRKTKETTGARRSRRSLQN